MKIYFVGLLGIAVLLVGCKKTPATFISTTVSGTVMDNNQNLPIVGAKIIVQHERYKFNGDVSGYFPAGPPTTTLTGPAGKYSITFEANSTGDTYTITLSQDTGYLNLNNRQTISIGGNKTMNFDEVKLARLKAHIIVVNNPTPPLGLYTGIGLGAVIHGTNNDTVVTLQVVPNWPGRIIFDIQVPGTPNSLYGKADFTLSGFSATYYQTFTVYPSTFSPQYPQ